MSRLKEKVLSLFEATLFCASLVAAAATMVLFIGGGPIVAVFVASACLASILSLVLFSAKSRKLSFLDAFSRAFCGNGTPDKLSFLAWIVPLAFAGLGFQVYQHLEAVYASFPMLLSIALAFRILRIRARS